MILGRLRSNFKTVTNGSSIFFGPEVGVLGNERFSQLRVGASITQIMFKNVQIDLSAGYANDSVVGPGAYGTVELEISRQPPSPIAAPRTSRSRSS